ncbi:MAG: AAA family ATPase [Thermodesulfobacteriota bacterium]|nr:AAA family ATPase [Thermodesulfobacteriota bacterium]
MKLESITIKNFRCFEELRLGLHPELTVLIAPNCGGKTTLIDAARIAVWPFVKAFDLGSQTGKSATIQIEDVRKLRSDGDMEAIVPAVVTASGKTKGVVKAKWSQTREKLKPRTNTIGDSGTKALTMYAARLQRKVRDEHSGTIDLPLIAYLGTGRLWYQGRYTSVVDDKKLDNSTYSRLWGYQNCLTAASSYKQFEEWYCWVYLSYREQQIKQLEGSSSFDEKALKYFENAISVVKSAVNEITKQATRWENIEYSASQQQQLVLNHPDYGSLPLSQLSDGVRNMVVLVSDIAFRCIKLNPHLGEQAALETTGIVMIDEVDMFLHPAWQQTIIGSLRRAFPKIQFIVTTHSPQVLSTVPKECIRVLGTNIEGNAVAAIPKAFSYGEPSNDILQAIMHVDPQPPVPEKQELDLLTSLVDQGDYKSGKTQQLLSKLKQKLNENHPQIVRVERSIRRQKALNG